MNTNHRIHLGLLNVLVAAALCGAVQTAIFVPESFAQIASVDDLMAPSNGATAGALERGDLLVTALRREKVDATSARLAMQSLSKLFDFRLTRTGDKYLYKVNSSRKLTMLRYQRAEHVYEAVLNPETDEYEARLLDAVADAPVPEPSSVDPLEPETPGMNDDGEIDVEREAFGQENSDVRDDDEFPPADPDDPVQPVDPALAGVRSPDDDIDVDDTKPEQPNGNGLQAWNEENLREDTTDTVDDTPEIQDLPGTSTPIVESNVTVRPKRVVEHESVTFSTISLVMFILGLGALIFSLFALIIPAYRVRRRCADHGMVIREMLTIASNMRIARLSVDNHDCIVAIHPEKMSFIAPCPPDDDALWAHIKSKVYWYQMSKTPVSDLQMASMVQAFYEDKKEEEEDRSSSKSEIISENSIYADPEFSEEDLSEDNVFTKLEVTYKDAEDDG